MKSLLLRLFACVTIAISALAASAATPAAAATTRTLTLHYCWTLTTFGPNGCNTSWPAEILTLTGSPNQGTVSFGGTYKFTNNKNNIRLEFIAPEPGIDKVVYTGARYAGGGSNCYRGSMVAEFPIDPDLTGVWLGCVTP